MAGGDPCIYCGQPLPWKRKKVCLAEACLVAQRLAKQAKAKVRVAERYAEEPGYREAVLARNEAWREANRETWLECNTRYYRANREVRIARAARQATARRAHKRASMVLPFTASQLRARLSMYHGCWICGSETWDEVDHVKPIAKGGPHILANLRPACRDCNRRKSATWPISTTRERDK